MTIPFRYPLKPEVLPAPGMTTLDNAAVTPYPMMAPAFVRLSVVIPIVWSAKSSMTQTFKPLDQEPGFLAP